MKRVPIIYITLFWAGALALPSCHAALENTIPGNQVVQATTTARGSVELATDGEVAANLAVQADDSRLVANALVNVVEDTTPRLGDDLDYNGKAIKAPDAATGVNGADLALRAQRGGTGATNGGNIWLNPANDGVGGGGAAGSVIIRQGSGASDATANRSQFNQEGVLFKFTNLSTGGTGFEFESDLAVNTGFFGLAGATTKTLTTGVFTADKSYHVVAAETGTADDLDTVNGGVEGWTVILRTDAGDTITVKDGTGNIELNGGADVSLTGDIQLLLMYDGADWTDVFIPGAGSGDVVGPSSATDNAIARFDTTTGKLLQGSSVIIDDSDNVSGIGNITLSGTVDGVDIAGDVLVDTLADAKGDIFAATAADTVTRLPGGANDQVLTYDTAEATGLKWAAAGGGAWTNANATGDELVNNSTVMVNHTELQFSVDANSTYAFFLIIVFNSGSTPDFKNGWSYPSGTTIKWRTSSSSNWNVSETYENFISGSGSGDRGSMFSGRIKTAGTAGTVSVQFAQFVADASDTTLLEGSVLSFAKISP